jgi:hypothetical protein
MVAALVIFESSRPVLGEDVEFIGDRKVVEYLLTANRAREAVRTPPQGRLKARYRARIVSPESTGIGHDLDATVEAVWDETSSYRRAAIRDLSDARGRGVALEDCKATLLELLEAGDKSVLVRYREKGESRMRVGVFPRDVKLHLRTTVLEVLPNSGVSGYQCDTEASVLLDSFLQLHRTDASLRNEVIEKGDEWILLMTRKETGDVFESRWSKELDGRLLGYRSIPNPKAVSMIKYEGRLEWATDTAGVVYLKSHVYDHDKSIDPRLLTWKSSRVDIDEFTSTPDIVQGELTFEGLKLPEHARVFVYDRDGQIPIWTGTVGGWTGTGSGKPPVAEEEAKSDEIVSEMKSRGFARPERIRSK